MLSVLRFEMRRLSRDVITVFFGLAFPVLLLLVFGATYGNDPNELFGESGTVDATVPAYMVVVVAVTGMMSFPLSMAEYREQGILRQLRVSERDPRLFLVGQFFSNALLTLAGLVLLAATGRLVFGAHLGVNWRFPIALFLTVWSLYGIGLLVAALAPSQKAATLLANLVYFPMIFLTGASIPFELLPTGLQTVGKALPMYHSVEWMRSGWSASSGDGTVPSALVLLAIGAVGSAAAVRQLRP